MYPTFNSRGLQYWEWNNTLTTYRTGMVELSREIKFFGFRIWFELTFKLETEIEFSLHFRVDKDYNEDAEYWETPIFFIGIDPAELDRTSLMDYDGSHPANNVFIKHRSSWCSLAIGKWWVFSV